MTDEARPAGPDPERDKRIDAYRDRERRRAARALDRYIDLNMNGGAGTAAADVAGDRLVEAVGDYVLARLQRGADEPPWGESSHLAVRGCEIHGDACAGDPLQQKAHYGVPTWESAHLGGQHADMWAEECVLCRPAPHPTCAEVTTIGGAVSWVCTGGCPR